MFGLKVRKNAFTLAETLIVCSVFAFMVVGIILGINRAFIFMNNTRLQVRATNLTREGVEMVYNLRDTNRRKHYGDKDAYWINVGVGNSKIGKGIYVIKEGMASSGDSYVYLSGLSVSDVENFYSIEGFFNDSNVSNRNASKITFTGTYSFYSGGKVATGNLGDLMEGAGVEFYRVLRVYGIYCKNSSTTADETSCTKNTDPKEMRFCVKTFYKMGVGHHSSELCSIMTNFME